MRILNPTLQPVVLHVLEVVGHFYPLSKQDQVCTLIQRLMAAYRGVVTRTNEQAAQNAEGLC